MDEHTFKELESLINLVIKTTDIRSRDLMYDLLDAGFIHYTDVERIRELVDEGGEGAGMKELLKVLKKNYTEACYLFVVDLLVNKQLYQMEDDVTQAVARSESQIKNPDDNKSMVLTEEAMNTDVVKSQAQGDGETQRTTDERFNEAVDDENVELVEELVTRMAVGDLFQETGLRFCCLALKIRNLPLVKLLFCTQLFTDSPHIILYLLSKSAIESDFVEGIEYLYSQCISVGLEETFLHSDLLAECVRRNSLNVTSYILLLPKLSVSPGLLEETMSVEMLTLLLSNPSIKQTINGVGRTAVIRASAECKTEIVQCLITHGADVNQADTNGLTALMVASEKGYTETVQCLITHGADANQANSTGVTALMWASGNGHTEIVPCLITHGAGVNQADSTGITALMIASGNGHTEIVQCLITQGADVNPADSACWTALMWALPSGNTETVQCLITHGADVNQGDSTRVTTLMRESNNGYTEIGKCLITHGAVVNQADSTGWTALMEASGNGHTEIVQCLITHGAGVNKANSIGVAALMRASGEGHTETVQCLITHGADVNQADTNGLTGLMVGSQNGYKETVQCLITNGADVNKASSIGVTSLMLASDNGHTETVQCLITHGADVNQADSTGITALTRASGNGQTETVQYLIAHGAGVNQADSTDVTALMRASGKGQTETVQCLITHGAVVNQADSTCITALMRASGKGQTETVQCLITHGADVNQADTNGLPALMVASQKCYAKTVQCLITNGADVNQADRTGVTALMKASGEGHTEIVQCLITYGADVNQADTDGWTALMRASEEGHTETVQCLITHRADVNKTTSTGWTALMWASGNGETETVQYLITHGAGVNKASSTGVTALMKASEEGHTETVQCLIKHRADVNKTTSTGSTALMMASRWGQIESVLCLITYCTDINKADNEGKTALSQCCLYGINGNKESYIKMVKKLVESGADLTSRYYGVKFVQLIIAHHSIEIFRYLIRLKPEICDLTEQGENIFHLLAKVNYEYTIEHFEWLSQYGVDINHLNSNSDTPLMIAALLLNDKYLEVCTQHPAININIQNNKGHTALHGCILGFTMIITHFYKYYGGEIIYAIYLRCVDILLHAHIDVNIQHHMGRTALMLAARENDKILTRKLLDAGARVDLRDTSGYWALLYIDMYEIDYDLTCFRLLLTGYGSNILDLPCIHGETFIQTALQFPLYWDANNVASFVTLLVYYNCSLHNVKSQFGGSRYTVIGLDEFNSEHRHKLRQLLYLSGAPEEEITSVLDFQVEDKADNIKDPSYSKNRGNFNKVCFGVSLQSKCIRVIRQHLRLAIKENMKYLGIPRPLMEFLLLRDVLPATEDGILGDFEELSDDWDYCSYSVHKNRDDHCSQYTYGLRQLLTYDEQIRKTKLEREIERCREKIRNEVESMEECRRFLENDVLLESIVCDKEKRLSDLEKELKDLEKELRDLETT